MTSSRPRPDLVHELFAAQARRAPGREAVTLAGERLTYDELDRHANQLANHLARLGVGPEVPVGICVERGLEMVVGVLAALKAGGAYLPLDPAYPAQRLRFMLEEAAVPVLLTLKRLVPALPDCRARVVCLDADWGQIARESVVPPETGVTADNLAYIIYTSGSTGRPKGTMVSHRGLPALAMLQGERWGARPDGRTLQFASLTFDASVIEILMTLCRGGTLVLGRPDELKDPRELAALMDREGVTFVILPPTVIAQLPPDAGVALEVLAAAGEACPAPLARAWAARLRFVNAYGPTEASVSSTCFSVPPDVDASRPLPIGQPFPGVRARVLDERLEPAAPGAVGEICLGGPALARGYLGRADLTAERFVPDPSGEEAGGRLYRTGDLGRLLPGNDIEFLGRTDDQVKVRGFRIELGEVETVLNHHPRVSQAVAVAREDAPGDRRLVAYIVPREGGEPALAGLREHLGRYLPSFMIPSAFVMLKELPLTPAGKVDRRALPAPEQGRMRLSTDYVAPRTDTEAALAAMWAGLFGVERVGADDSFFELGGHSLLATQVAARVRDAFGVELTLAAVFAHPTVAALAALIDEQRGGAAAAAADGAPAARGAARIGPVPRDRPLPLSFSQERVWFVLQLDPGNMAYNAQAAMRLRGRLDVAALGRALAEIVRRHEIFRTTFPAVDDRPAQVVHPDMPLPLESLDLTALDAAGRAAEVDRLIAERVGRPFDVTRLPLVRWTLMRLDADEHLLLHVEHHFVHDGWSFSVFMRELVALYEAFAAGRASPLEEPALQFGDFAAWQREWMAGEEAAAQLAFWKEKLAGAPLVLQLPEDRPRPPVQTFGGRSLRVDLPAGAWDAVRAVSRRAGASPFMTMLAAFAVLLRMWTGQDDLVVGTGTANRRWRETEGLIGMIINNVALRIDLAGDPTFSDLIGRVRGVALEAYANQDLPFDRVVDAVQPARDLSRNPVYQAMFSFHDNPLPALELFGPLRVSIQESLSNGTAKFDLNVVVIPRPEQHVASAAGGDDAVTMIWEYNTDLFDDDTVARMLGHYRTLLDRALASPGGRVSALGVVGPAERRRLLGEWNDTAREYPRGRCIHELFAEQAARTPEAVAATFAGRDLTYRELDRRANRLAHRLRRLGVGREVPVGIFVERSLAMVIGILAVLKAGGAYVPLDPDYPASRLELMLDDARAPLLLTQRRLAGRLPGDAATVFLDEWEDAGDGAAGDGAAGDGAAGDEDRCPRSGVTPANLAYIMYTSGSTGRPKGVMVPHRGVCNLAGTQREAFGLVSSDRVLQFTTLCFDVSVWEIFLTLTVGATLVLARAEDLRDPDLLSRVLDRERVSAALLLPSALAQLPAGSGPALRALVTGAEPCPPAVAAALARRVRFVNAYGPTEATVCVTACEVPAEFDESRPVPIGRPLPNCRAYILDARLEPTPVGVPGELYIGGDQLARGYYGRPQATAEAFVPDPWGEPGALLYRTGDLVRRLPDGNIEFRGRADSQVKLRGYRIELGDVETALLQHPAVCEAVAAIKDDERAGRRLFAYIVAHEGAAPSSTGLRDHLKQRLPEYMVPAAVVTLEAMPRSPSGKVDRRALPAPDLDELRSERFVAPRTPLEAALAGIWAEVLGAERVGVHDDFFELGGHSLLATQVLSRVRRALGAELPLRALFTGPTVAELARAVEERLAGAAGAAAAPDAPLAGGAAGDEALLAGLDRLSDDKVDELLRALADDEGVS